jgi:F0F1-type ATP synthase membrane subunit b/b'
MFKREALIMASIFPAIILLGLLMALVWPRIAHFFE